MALEPTLTEEEHGKLADALKAEYAKGDDGRFTLQVHARDGWALEDVAGLKSALSSEREAKRRLEQAQERFKDLDPDKARDALTKVEEMRNWKPEDKVKEQMAAREAQLKEKFEADIASERQQRESLWSQFSEQALKTPLVSAIAKHKGNVDLLLPRALQDPRLVEEDGEGGKRYVTRIMDKNGNPAVTSKSGSTDPMDLDEYVESLKKQFPSAFEGSSASGGDAQSSRRSGQRSGDDWLSLPPEERLARQYAGSTDGK